MVLLPQFGTHLSCFGRLEAIEKKNQSINFL